ncbi:MAG: hypothetical protein A3J24_06360 [Deltaproteobacteria bacterium RIFCSPLOWO2_02_FULL_53_8]|nr:MAG: hypothetical protein A3J24_06360 [Deltaproteobacteria bacterium RIFCSPLOWO2_02_FULL_53_8]
MAKTIFTDGDKSLGILGSVVLAAWLNKIFGTGGHVHDGVDDDGHAPKVNLASHTEGILPTGMGGAPTGVLLPFAGVASIPVGWLLCYGQAVSRTTYADLFAAVSTTYGVGDGSTTFNLPDMRGRLPLGQDNMGGTSANRVTDAAADSVGNGLGAETHQHTVPSSGSHDHQMIQGGTGLVWATGDTTGKTDVSGAHGHTADASSGMNPCLVLNYIIKT